MCQRFPSNCLHEDLFHWDTVHWTKGKMKSDSKAQCTLFFSHGKLLKEVISQKCSKYYCCKTVQAKYILFFDVVDQQKIRSTLPDVIVTIFAALCQAWWKSTEDFLELDKHWHIIRRKQLNVWYFKPPSVRWIHAVNINPGNESKINQNTWNTYLMSICSVTKDKFTRVGNFTEKPPEIIKNDLWATYYLEQRHY